MATAATPVSSEQIEAPSNTGIQFDERLKRVIAAGKINLENELARLRSLGIIDEQGNLLKTELPPDMQQGAERDFGG